MMDNQHVDTSSGQTAGNLPSLGQTATELPSLGETATDQHGTKEEG